MTSPARAVLRSETRLFLREPGSLFWVMAFPVLLLGILGAIPSFRETTADLGGQRVIDLYVPITILLAAVLGAVQAMPAVITTYREQQVLRRIATTPAEPWHLLVAQYVLHGGAVVLGATVVLIVGRVVLGVRIPGSPVAYLAVLALALAALLAIGGVISGVSSTTKASTALGAVVATPLMFSSGLWLPVQAMPDLLRRIVELTPMGAASLALDQAAQGSWPDLQHIGVLLCWTLGLGLLAARYFRWE